jgi:hypothetical protein
MMRMIMTSRKGSMSREISMIMRISGPAAQESLQLARHDLHCDALRAMHSPPGAWPCLTAFERHTCTSWRSQRI